MMSLLLVMEVVTKVCSTFDRVHLPSDKLIITLTEHYYRSRISGVLVV